MMNVVDKAQSSMTVTRVIRKILTHLDHWKFPERPLPFYALNEYGSAPDVYRKKDNIHRS